MKKDIVLYIILDKNRILLEKRKDSDRYPGLWAFPSGHVEIDDKVGTLIKEIEKETGAVPEEYVLLESMQHGSGDTKSLLHVFLITKFSGQTRNETGEGRELKWFSFDEAREIFNSETNFHEMSIKILDKVMEAANTL